MHRPIQRVELIYLVLICNLLGFVRPDFGGAKWLLKVHLALFLLFAWLACNVTVSAVEDNFQGENGEKFSQQNGPSYTYEINK